MHVSQLKKSNYLTRGDVGTGILVTIKALDEQNLAKEGQPAEMRWCLHFNECDKPLVLNSTNGQIIASIVKSEETDDWIGHKIVLYDDPNISFGGKLVGGIRVRAPRGQAAKQIAARPAVPKPAPKPVEPEPEEEIEPEVGDPDVPF